MDRGRIVLREKVTENAPLATFFEKEAQEKPEVDCVLRHKPARRNKKNFTDWQGRLIQFCNFFSRKWVGEFFSEPELVRKKEQKDKNAVSV